MSHTVKELYDAAMELSRPDRTALASLISESTAPASTLHPARGDELRRRAGEIDGGEVRPVP